MKKIGIVAIAALISVSILVLAICRISIGPQEVVKSADKYLPDDVPEAVWDWNFLNRNSSDAILKSLKSEGVTAVYLDISQYAEFYEMPESTVKEQLLASFDTSVHEYLKLALQESIAVHALVGNPTWGNASHRYLNRILLSYVNEYNLNNPKNGFAGIQFDIEPYNQVEFNSKTSRDIYTEFLDTVKDITNQVQAMQTQSSQQTTFALGFAIPYWFDGENTEKIQWQGKTKFPFYHVVDQLERLQHGYIAVMAYRTVADGDDGVIQHSKTELDYVRNNASNVTAIIGQETSNVEPARISYFSADFESLHEQLLKIDTEFSNNPNFGGFIFNSADSFLELK